MIVAPREGAFRAAWCSGDQTVPCPEHPGWSPVSEPPGQMLPLRLSEASVALPCLSVPQSVSGIPNSL